MNQTQLPKGYTFRPARMEDVVGAANMFNACSRDLFGKDEIRADLLEEEWKTPGFNVQTDTLLAIDSQGCIAGYYEFYDTEPHISNSVWGRVHPEHRGRGIGSYLLDWAEGRARQAVELAPPDARAIVRAFVMNINQPAHTLLEDHGFNLVRYNLRMVIELDQATIDPSWQAGISMRAYQGEQDLPEIIRVVHDSFKDHWGYVSRPFEEELTRFQHFVREYPIFDPELWLLAVNEDGKLVGTSLNYPYIEEDHEMGWVGTLGVIRPYRRLGIGMALLQESFALFQKRGLKRVGLGVDAESLTGATRLYEKAGMHSDPNRTFAYFEKELRPGKDLSTQSLD